MMLYVKCVRLASTDDSLTTKNEWSPPPRPYVNKSKAPEALRRYAFNSAGFRQYGLYYCDVLNEMHNNDVKEAIRRLPAHIQVRTQVRKTSILILT